LGYEIDNVKIYFDPNKDFVINLLDQNGKPIAQQIDKQFNAIPNLYADWS